MDDLQGFRSGLTGEGGVEMQRINRPLVRTFSSRLVSSTRLVSRPTRHGRWATDIEANIIQDKAVQDRRVTVT